MFQELTSPQEQNIALSPEIMKDLGREEQGLRLPDGNYFGALMVFHHLHCLVCPLQKKTARN
jgi:hypothetical protein